MTHHYQLTDHKGGGQEARFLVDGVRVSRERYEAIKNAAYTSGKLDCFHTSGKPLPGGKTRRTNHSSATTGFKV
jgi:hypothetical protein